ncbi:hypothetical protein L249_4541 [Ophiocordyceps polyrhachis-furcata BCC 54312]|uniref:Uncharacterized protein n=1 Tax=Ophiocordyceps polyrhachis-furcata BCC 54312 TaxID=1330021 RepID=A0A367KZ43_9HYPO|nr:hypothetical protein L249_4541 [Ophiocordyceps polyrhachis-furcata BCC 54312]
MRPYAAKMARRRGLARDLATLKGRGREGGGKGGPASAACGCVAVGDCESSHIPTEYSVGVVVSNMELVQVETLSRKGKERGGEKRELEKVYKKTLEDDGSGVATLVRDYLGTGASQAACIRLYPLAHCRQRVCGV